MKKKNLLVALLMTSMVFPTYPVFAMESMDEMIKNQAEFEESLDAPLEKTNFENEENIKTTYFHVLYEENGLTVATRSASSSQEYIGEQLGAENNLWFYSDLLDSCPEGYNLIENEVELKKKTFQPVEGNEVIEKELWEFLNRENRMPGESFYLKVSVKKQDLDTKIQSFDSTLPIQLTIRTQDGCEHPIEFENINELKNDPKTVIAQKLNEYGINFQFNTDTNLNLSDLLVECKIGETLIGYKLKGKCLNWDGTISSFITKEKVESLDAEIPVRMEVLTVKVDKDGNPLGNILTGAYFNNTSDFGLFESPLEPNLTVQKVNTSLARESTDLKINQKITIDDLILVTEPANPAYNQEQSKYYTARVKASEGTIFYPSGNLTNYNCDYYSIGFESLDGQYRSFSPYFYVITQEYEDGFKQVYKQYETKTTLIKNGLEGPIGLDLLMENLPEGYSFVESLDELKAKSFNNFIQATQEGEVPCLRDGQITDKEYPHIKKGYYYITIPIKKIKSSGTPVQSLEDLEDNVPILFKCASDFNIELNIYYSRLPLGTKSDLEDFGNVSTNSALDNLTQLERLKRALLFTIRQRTHYQTQPLLTPTSFDDFIQDLVPVYCGPNNEDILYYETNSILVLRDPRMDSYRKSLTVQDEDQAKQLTEFLTDSTGNIVGTVSEDKKESFKEWIEKFQDFKFENSEYNYALDLENTLISLDDEGINISFDLLAKLTEESKIKLIFSGLRNYLENLLLSLQESNNREISPLGDQLNLEQNEAQMIPLILYSDVESEFGIQNSGEEEISLKLNVNELFTQDKFDVNKATEVLKKKIATNYQNYSEVLEKADLSSHVENIQQKDLMKTSFPVQEGKMVEITIEKKESLTPDNSSSNNSSVSKPSSGGGSNPSSSTPAEPEETKPSTSGTVGKKTLYRFYNKLTGEHFFTSDKNERDTLLKDEAWSNEGHGWTTPEFSNYPIYRLCNPTNGDHHYTMDRNEYDTLQNTYGWIGEGVGLYSAGEKDERIVLLHRLYNPNATGAGSHHYTADENERDELVKRGWSYEGTAWYGLTDSES